MAKPIWDRGHEGGVTRNIDRDALFRNLSKVTDVLTYYDIKWWLSHGTALGAIRDDNFIEWDDDADIGLDYKDRAKMANAEEALRTLGFFVPHDGEEGMPHYDTVFIKDGEKIEGWWFEKFDDYYIYDIKRCGNRLKHPAKYYDELKTHVFRGKSFNIPNHIEDYLEMMYDSDWRIPNRWKKYNDLRSFYGDKP